MSGRDGSLTVAGERGDRTLPAGYVREHVELAYAATVHGVQGETAASAHLLLGEHTSAASAYVGMTRGRAANTAHLVADSIEEAREQWVAVFARDRADLGPAHAAELAQQEAARYAQLRPLEQVLAELHHAWTVEADCVQRLADAEQCRDMLTDIVALTRDRDATLPALEQAYQDARASAEHATAASANQLESIVSAHASRAHRCPDSCVGRATDMRPARPREPFATGQAGSANAAPPCNQAAEDLARWSASWQPYLPTMPTRTEDVVAFADWFDDTPRIHAAFDQYARTAAEHADPEYRDARAAADAAVQHRDDAWRAHHDADAHYRRQLAHYGNLARVEDPASALADVEHSHHHHPAAAG